MTDSALQTDIAATITVENDQTVLRFACDLRLPVGDTLISYDADNGSLTLRSETHQEAKQRAWIDFLDRISTAPPEPDFMRERPLNQPLQHKQLFPED